MDYILERVIAERKNQDATWGVQKHSPSEWLGILVEEVGEVAKEVNNINFATVFAKAEYEDNYKAELIQVAAVAIAMIECMERDE